MLANHSIDKNQCNSKNAKTKLQTAIRTNFGIEIWDWNQMLRSHNNLHLKRHTRSNMSVQRRNGQHTWILTWLCPKFYTALGFGLRDLFVFFSLFSSLLLLLVLLLCLLRHLLSLFIFFPTVLLLLLVHLLLVSPCASRTDGKFLPPILIKRKKRKMKLNSCKLHTCKTFSSYRNCGWGFKSTRRFRCSGALAIPFTHHYVRKQRYFSV